MYMCLFVIVYVLKMLGLYIATRIDFYILQYHLTIIKQLIHLILYDKLPKSISDAKLLLKS